MNKRGLAGRERSQIKLHYQNDCNQSLFGINRDLETFLLCNALPKSLGNSNNKDRFKQLTLLFGALSHIKGGKKEGDWTWIKWHGDSPMRTVKQKNAIQAKRKSFCTHVNDFLSNAV